jgi:hypothetical protein
VFLSSLFLLNQVQSKGIKALFVLAVGECKREFIDPNAILALFGVFG